MRRKHGTSSSRINEWNHRGSNECWASSKFSVKFQRKRKIEKFPLTFKQLQEDYKDVLIKSGGIIKQSINRLSDGIENSFQEFECKKFFDKKFPCVTAASKIFNEFYRRSQWHFEKSFDEKKTSEVLKEVFPRFCKLQRNDFDWKKNIECCLKKVIWRNPEEDVRGKKISTD